MAYNVLTCNAANLPNTGSRKFCYEDLQSIYKIILSDVGFEFATETNALTENDWQDQIESLSDRLYPLPEISLVEDQSEEAAFEEFPQRSKIQTNNGKLQAKLWIRAPKYLRNKMNNFQGQQWRFFLIDEGGKILGTTDDDIVFKGMKGSIYVDNDRLLNDGSKSGDLFPVVISFDDVQEWKEEGVILQPLLETTPWNPKNLDGNIDVTVTVDSAAAALIVVTLTATYSSELLSGFGTATANWIKTGAGTITSVVDNGGGTYNLVASGADFATGTINLTAATVLSLDGYESTGTAVVTI